MNTAAAGQGQAWDDSAEEAPERPSAGSRRRLLGGAAGGMALAASGLFLPVWLEETEAREGALGGAKGGRHGKDHRGRDRHKHRDHGDKKDKQKDRDKPGDIVPTHPAIEVRNSRLVPVQTRGWQRDCINETCDWYVPNGWDWAAIPNGRHGIKQFRSDFRYAVVQIGTDRVIFFDFAWPGPATAAIYSGGWEKNQNPKGERLAIDHLAINDSISVPGIKATRDRDGSRYVWLNVELT